MAPAHCQRASVSDLVTDIILGSDTVSSSGFPVSASKLVQYSPGTRCGPLRQLLIQIMTLSLDLDSGSATSITGRQAHVPIQPQVQIQARALTALGKPQLAVATGKSLGSVSGVLSDPGLAYLSLRAGHCSGVPQRHHLGTGHVVLDSNVACVLGTHSLALAKVTCGPVKGSVVITGDWELEWKSLRKMLGGNEIPWEGPQLPQSEHLEMR